VATQSIETPFVGTYRMSGVLEGRLSVSRTGDTLSVSGTADGQTFSGSLDVGELGRALSFPLSDASLGIVSRLQGHDGQAQASRSLVVAVAADMMKVAVQQGGQSLAVTLTRDEEALIAYGSYMPCMKLYASQVADFYRSRGYSIHFMTGSWDTVRDTLVAAEESGQPFSRFVIVSHGGWDGPMFVCPHTTDQESRYERADDFGDLVRAMRRGLTPDAIMIFSSCHSGGSDRFEDDTPQVDDDTHEVYDFGYRYSDDLAKRTGRVVVGPMGETSTGYSLRLVEAVEGEGVTKQETRVSTPSGTRTVHAGHTVGQILGLRPRRHAP
jgi:hypothetical protein